MKIGVFGDSYCECRYVPAYPAWWELLRRYGHDVTSFGISSSSIMFSANKILKYGDQFDFIIWTVTTPFRISIAHDDDYIHISGSNHNMEELSTHGKTKAKLALDYLNLLASPDELRLVGTALVEHVSNKFKNLLTIACFPDPLPTDFNLYQLCSNEADAYFPGQQLHKVYEDYNDIRTCHLSIENNKVLARLVADNLVPGIFVADYEDFSTPAEPVDFYFRKR